MGWCTMGCPASGNSGFGTFSDSGRNRVPAPNEDQNQSMDQSEQGGGGASRCGADLAGTLTFGWAADHDDGDDALLGADHACLLCSELCYARGGFARRGEARGWS